MIGHLRTIGRDWSRRSVRLFSQSAEQPKVIQVPVLDPHVKEQFEQGLKPRKHSGKRKSTARNLPTHLEHAALRIIKKYRNKDFMKAVEHMQNRIYHFPLPPEAGEVEQMTKEVEKRETAKDNRNYPKLTEDIREEVEAKRKERVLSVIRNRLYGWKEMRLSEYEGVVYMAARLSANFSSLMHIFNEIKLTFPDYSPKTLFDFGSGIGTTMWAANESWPRSISEHFNVDCNKDLNNLSNLLLKSGDDNQPTIYNNVLYREFLPVGNHIQYDLIVSAFSLKELPNFQSRVHVIENLWQKTQDTLVIVEHGNMAGFQAIMEARNLILKMSGYDPTAIYSPRNDVGTQVGEEVQLNACHIVAPCPHHYSCPKMVDSKGHKCNFRVKHWPIDIGQTNYGVEEEHFSYVVFRKDAKKSQRVNWPRIVRNVTKNKGHTICQVCTAEGKLIDLTVAKSKFDTLTYRCAKLSEWGDLLPVQITKTTKQELKRQALERKLQKKADQSDDL